MRSLYRLVSSMALISSGIYEIGGHTDRAIYHMIAAVLFTLWAQSPDAQTGEGR